LNAVFRATGLHRLRFNSLDELFAIELEINGQSTSRRLSVRRERSKPLLETLEKWLREERKKLSSVSPLAKAMNYGLKENPTAEIIDAWGKWLGERHNVGRRDVDRLAGG
jgi:hypothetical protein